MEHESGPRTDNGRVGMHNDTWNIAEVRAMYDHFVTQSKHGLWAPRRPYEEQVLLDIMKKRMFAMIVDYNFTEL